MLREAMETNKDRASITSSRQGTSLSSTLACFLIILSSLFRIASKWDQIGITISKIYLSEKVAVKIKVEDLEGQSRKIFIFFHLLLIRLMLLFILSPRSQTFLRSLLVLKHNATLIMPVLNRQVERDQI